jgi:hypothetical protein
MTLFRAVSSLAIALSLTAFAFGDEKPAAPALEVNKIWDAAPHNAFTDLIRFKDQWYLTFREGSKHVSPDGKVRILQSNDAKTWHSVALLSSSDQDVRECKLSLTPDNRLMLSGAMHNLTPGLPSHYSYVWFSSDGTHWSQRTKVIDDSVWLWRVVWHEGTAYGLGYSCDPKNTFLRLYTSADGIAWKTLVPAVYSDGFPNESAALFLKDGRMLILLRRDGGNTHGQLGISSPPYTPWEWKDLGQRIGSPDLVQLPDGRIVAPVRLLNPMRTSLCWLDPARGTLTEFLKLPSGGDGGYPGAVLRNGTLYVSYYSSHQQHQSCIYLAKVQLEPADSRPAEPSH